MPSNGVLPISQKARPYAAGKKCGGKEKHRMGGHSSTLIGWRQTTSESGVGGGKGTQRKLSVGGGRAELAQQKPPTTRLTQIPG